MRACVVLAICIALMAAGIFGIGYSSCDQAPVKSSEAAEAAQADKYYCSTPYSVFELGLNEGWVFIHRHHEDVIAVGTVFIAAFTIVLGLFTVSLAGATEKLVRGTEATARVQLRAYVHNRKIEWRPARRYSAPWGDEMGWVFTVEWHNFGPTRARHFLNHVNWDTFTTFEGDLPSPFPFDDKGVPQPGATYIAPVDSTLSDHLFIEASILEAVRVGHLRLYLWGWATYRDVFSDIPEHETQFCFELNRVDGDPHDLPTDAEAKPTIFFNFRVCGRHNCADEDCNQEAAYAYRPTRAHGAPLPTQSPP